jgi:SNF2 family DNA or RNA helicase
MLAWVGQHEQEPIAAPIVVAQLVRLKQFALAYAETEEVMVRNKETGELQAKTRVKLSEPSSKLDVVMDYLEDNPTKQFVVFSESKQAINLLAARLVRANISHVVLTGDTAQAARSNIVDKFQAREVRAFLGTIHAGGEGITLTAADTVIFLDRTWNPSRNRQAEDRLHRIGQRNAVQVIDIVARDSVDGGRLQELNLKWSWLKELLGDKKVEANA